MQKILFWLIIVLHMSRIAIFAYNDLKAEEQKEPAWNQMGSKSFNVHP